MGLNITHTEPEYIDFNVQKLLPHKLSQFGPSVAVGDVNGDRLDDLFIGGSRNRKGRFLLQTTTGTFVNRDLLPGADSSAKVQEDMGTLLFDADGDGDVDLYIASGSIEGNAGTDVFQDRLYVNDGKGGYTLSVNGLPVNLVSKSCVKAVDFDRDGDLDLFVGGRVEPDKYPKPVSSFILRNDSGKGAPKFTDVTAQVAPQLKDIGLVCDALWTDPDNDGWPDLMLAGEWMPLMLLKNEQGKHFSPTADASFGKAKGWWNSITSGDFDHDGDTDYLVGNLGLNARMRASDREPVRIYAGDFDNNGFYDAIPTIFIPDAEGVRKEYPFHGREDLIKQMIAMRRRFPYYKDFTQASIDKLLTPEERKDALVLEANYLQSVYIRNDGAGKFTLQPLPVQAQLGPGVRHGHRRYRPRRQSGCDAGGQRLQWRTAHGPLRRPERTVAERRWQRSVYAPNHCQKRLLRARQRQRTGAADRRQRPRTISGDAEPGAVMRLPKSAAGRVDPASANRRGGINHFGQRPDRTHRMRVGQFVPVAVGADAAPWFGRETGSTHRLEGPETNGSVTCSGGGKTVSYRDETNYRPVPASVCRLPARGLCVAPQE